MNVSDTLTAAFKTLRKDHGYFARKSFWCCQTCATYDIDKRGKSDKYVFFHQQDAQRLRSENGCYLAWSGDGELIARVMREHGLKVEWNGTIEERIYVSAPKFQENPNF